MSDGVWVKVHPDDVGDFGLEGIGEWAEITAMTGNPKRYTGIMLDGVEFWAFEWTDTVGPNSVTTQAGGVVDGLIIGGGMGYMNNLNGSGGGGSIVTNILIIPNGGPMPIEVGLGRPAGNNFEQYTGTPSSVGDIHTGYSYSAGFSYAGTTTDNVPERGEPYPSSITGSPETYAGGKKNSTTRYGDGGANSGNSGRNGVVIVRVPRSSDNSGLEGSEAGTPFDTTTLREALRETATEKVKSNRKRRK